MGPSIFSQLFMNPAFVTVGSLLAIVATPIIIHFINRLRYRKVRFAAMEFLLQSDKQNRQRVLLEQLLLLLLRILIVLALLALIARMILSQTDITFLGGQKAHHLILLDDSASQRQSWDETSAFKESIKTIKSMVAEGAKRPNTRTFELVLLSNPNKPLIPKVNVDKALVKDLEAKLNNLECSHRSLNMVEGLKTAGQILTVEKGSSKTLHVISDFRSDDWKNRSAIADSITKLDDDEIAVNLVRSLPDKEGETKNLSITSLTGNIQSVAPGVPVEFHVRVFNHSKNIVKKVRADVFQDGKKLPMTVRISEIAPETSVEKDFYVTFKKAGNHTLKLALESDALNVDNQRFMAIDIKNKHEILIIDGDKKDSTGDEDDLTSGGYLTFALAPNKEMTGYAPVIKSLDFLRKQSLDQYQSIYMLNVPELKPDTLDALTEYVKDGGGLVWFMGDQVKPDYYNEHLYKKSGLGLFPVPLRDKRRDVLENKDPEAGPDLKATDHPVFKVFKEIPILAKAFNISAFLPVQDEWERDDNIRKDGVTTIARFRSNAPLVFEHRIGNGKIITSLTSGGTMWTSLPSTKIYPFVILKIQEQIGKNDQETRSRIVGSTIDLSLDPSQYTEKIEILTPGKSAPRSHRIDAKYPNEKDEKSEEGKDAATSQQPRLELKFGSQNTDRPGIYAVKLSKTDNNDAFEEEWLAFNVPESESSLPVATDGEILDRVGEDAAVTIQQFGSIDWLEGKDVGQEVRRLLLILIVILFLLEQALAYRLSFHAAGSSNTKKTKLAGPARAATA